MPGVFVAAIDLGGTKAALALVGKDKSITHRQVLYTSDYLRPEDFVQAISAWLGSVQKELSPLDRIVGVGVGAPSGNRLHGTLDYAPNMPWEGVVPFATLLHEKTGLPCVLDNDANVAAYGEWEFGAAREVDDFIVITLGTGLGSAFICNGRMLYGHQGLAGEAGHMVIVPGGRPCKCGRQGCAETYCSATGFMMTFRELMQEAGREQELVHYFDPKAVEAAAKMGDTIARESFQKTAEWLGLTLANCCVFSNPRLIVLTGGLAGAGKLLLQPLQEVFERNLLRSYKGHVSLTFSALPGQDAALLGAASLVWRSFSSANPEFHEFL
ncbi:MAG: ROK family protein [Flavobacteriales bacterium]|nr:ROK family protein [Flavobacteriales bacterium]